MSKSEYTTISDELAKLGPGETLVIVSDSKETNGYWIGVGDAIASTVWIVTPQELEKIVRLGAKKLGLENILTGDSK